MKEYTHEEVKDRLIGKRGTPASETFESELQAEILSATIKDIRRKRKLTQEELGKLVGVQKSRISKLENHLTNVKMETIMKVFRALRATISFNVELQS